MERLWFRSSHMGTRRKSRTRTRDTPRLPTTITQTKRHIEHSRTKPTITQSSCTDQEKGYINPLFLCTLPIELRVDIIALKRLPRTNLFFTMSSNIVNLFDTPAVRQAAIDARREEQPAREVTPTSDNPTVTLTQ